MKKLIGKFQNPQNGYIVRGTTPYSFIFCLMFGPLYFLFKGNVKHFAGAAILALLTSQFYFLSWFIYPFYVYEINKDHYMKRGWVAIHDV